MMTEARPLLKLLFRLLAGVSIFALGFSAGRVSKELEGGLLKPQILSGRQAIRKIEEMGVKLPASARNISFLQAGFEEPFIWIAMEVVPADRDVLLRAWFQGIKSQPRRVPWAELANYKPPDRLNLGEEAPRFDPAAWTGDFCFRASDDPALRERVVLADDATGRFLLFSWKE